MQCFWALYLLERDVLTIPVWEQQQHVFVVAIVRFLMQTCTFLPAGNSVRLDLISKKWTYCLRCEQKHMSQKTYRNRALSYILRFWRKSHVRWNLESTVNTPFTPNNTPLKDSLLPTIAHRCKMPKNEGQISAHKNPQMPVNTALHGARPDNETLERLNPWFYWVCRF